MIDLKTESVIGLAVVAAENPSSRSGKPTHLSTIFRWIQHGVKSPTGDKVRLEAIRLGGKWVTSHEALQRFAERLTPDLDDVPAATRSAKRIQRASSRAEKALTRLGI